MKKKHTIPLLMLLIAIGILLLMCFFKPQALPIEGAEKILYQYLVDTSVMQPEYELYVLPVTKENTIINDRVYIFELRYAEDVENVGGRLLCYYAISKDGKKIYYQDSSMNEWIIKKE